VVQILAGSTVIANGTIVNPANGQFLTSTATYAAMVGDPLSGQTLSIRLGTSTSNDQNIFDICCAIARAASNGRRGKGDRVRKRTLTSTRFRNGVLSGCMELKFLRPKSADSGEGRPEF
jgi:hypothetical protein